MLHKQSPQLTLPDAQATGQRIYGAIVQGSGFNQRQCALDGATGAAPCTKLRRALGATAQTRPESRRLRRCRRAIKRDILSLGRARRADWATVNAGRLYAHKHPAIQARIATGQRPVASVFGKVHAAMILARGWLVSRFSDLTVRWLASSCVVAAPAEAWALQRQRQGF